MRLKLLHLAFAVTVTCWAQVPGSLVQEGAYWVQTTEATVDADGIRELHVVTRGDVSVRGAEGGRLSYSLRNRVRAGSQSEAARLIEEFRSHAMRHGSSLRLKLECCADRRVSPALTVMAPDSIRKTYVETLAGEIAATGLPGAVVAESGGGTISADRIGDAFYAKTVGGEIRVGVVDGPVKCISGAGGIRAENIGGQARLETAGGEIYVGEVAGDLHASSGGGNIHVTAAGASVTAHTSGGFIEVERAGGLVIAETANGSITVMRSQGVKCQSASGPIRLKGVSGTLRATTAFGDIIAVLAGGEDLESSFLDTSRGDVTVYIPSNMAVTVKAHNTPAGQRGKIVSDFPEIRTAAASGGGFAPAVAEGFLNGGGPILTVSAAGGNIFLRRR
jgi:hypothetical protein